MSKKKAQVTANHAQDLYDGANEMLQRCMDAVEEGLTGSSKDLRSLQRTLMLAARDLTISACKLYTPITMAESAEALALLQQTGKQ
jgi:hypothetical protein